jgi:hypothetical protein
MTFGYRKHKAWGSDCINWDLSGDLGMLAKKVAPLNLLLVVIWVGVCMIDGRIKNSIPCHMETK